MNESKVRGNFISENRTLYVTVAGMIAAIYVILTQSFAILSYSNIQIRFSEALTILPFLVNSNNPKLQRIGKAAVPGTFIGCLIANFFNPGVTGYDIVLGSLATLVAAYLTAKSKKIWIAAIWPVILNALVVGAILTYVYHLKVDFMPSLLFNGLSVGVGEFIACYGIGIPLVLWLQKNKTIQ